MIKLIASDIDGTLLRYGETELPTVFSGLIRRLLNAGVLFCPASGRQYHSLRRLFAPVADEACFLCENGAVVFGPGAEETAPILSKTAMPREDAMDLARAIIALPGCAVLISGQNSGYACGCAESYIQRIRDSLGNLMHRVERVEDVPEEIIKVSAFCPNGPEQAAGALGPRWGKYHMAVAGPAWLDFTLADKGSGLRGLCRSLGIGLEDVMAFGDNWNDVSMLEAAGTSWLMESADPALRARFPRRCADVAAVLENVLQELGG